MEFSIKILNQLRPILRSFRKAQKLTQTDIAKRLGITQQSYAQLEANPATASLERLFKVLAILEVDIILRERVVDVTKVIPDMKNLASLSQANLDATKVIPDIFDIKKELSYAFDSLKKKR
ncbi:putative transcriptional regulator [Beggiatoa alba B18LD]|uniref:Putative transcriptional regulator n=1 Tax=Beggiatoa alba B18LD TaxID=395493 RepID=I3CEC3_9GAMM|nr:helix-turn-helix transcriptional regulator [Beggiatoa alba]EIJ41966.1 putative transcriptional regulator [Beggiatoa alba B18LD]